MTYQDAVLYCIFIFLTVISPLMIALTIYGIYISLKFFSGVLIEFNERHFIPQEKEVSLKDRVNIALSSPIVEEEWYNKADKQFLRNYNKEKL